MRIRVILPTSMPYTVQLSLVGACALLFLFLCSTSCLGTPYEECHWDHVCGGFHFGYPFGKYNNGCGDPDFQLDCSVDDDWGGHPVMNINGDKYHILEPYFLDIYSNNHVMTIINDNLWLDKCNLSGNYSHFWWPGSHFQISADTYTNVTLSVHCNQSNEKMIHLGFLQLCGNDGYYKIQNLEEEAHFCKTHLQLPIKKDSEHLYFSYPTLPYWLGFEIKWQVDTNRSLRCKDCFKSNGRCGYNISDSTSFLCYCPDGTSHQPNCLTNGRKNNTAIVIGCSAGGVALIAIALVMFLSYYAKRRKSSPSQCPAGDFSKHERKDMEAGRVPARLKIGNLSIFSYDELRQATNCFHEDNELGDGEFGSVYLGKLGDGLIVAVKKLYRDNSRRVAQFINEVAIFSTLNHPRLVRLYGCTSAESPELLLVYEFVPNETLADHLHGNRRNPRELPWDTRLNIAIQTAEALAFLHNVDPPIFHGDVKTSNILLDENFNVKVGDFGLCRHVPVNVSHTTTTPQGTPGYVDPEYHLYYQLTEKSDVYSFGVVLVEIISAKLAVDINRDAREINLASMAMSKIQEGALHELVDPQLGLEMNDEVKVTISAVAELALRCLVSQSDDRPHIKEVVAQLEEIRGMSGVYPSPHEQSVSFPKHKHWRSFPTSAQDKWPLVRSAFNASA